MLDDKPHTSTSYIPNYSALPKHDGGAPSLDHSSSSLANLSTLSSTSGGGSLTNLPPVELKFTKNRKRTKKYARILMYIGYGQMIVDALAVIVTVLEMLQAGGLKHRNVKRSQTNQKILLTENDIFSKGWIVGIDMIELLGWGANFAQGWLMVRSTKLVVRQISTQEVNPQTQIQKYSERVSKAFKAVCMIIMGTLLVKAVTNLLAFIMLDNFLKDRFNRNYTEWRKDSKIATMDLKLLESEELDWKQINEIEAWWSVFGPTAMILDIVIFAVCCGSVICCFRTYKEGLEEFEESPSNPAFASEF